MQNSNFIKINQIYSKKGQKHSQKILWEQKDYKKKKKIMLQLVRNNKLNMKEEFFKHRSHLPLSLHEYNRTDPRSRRKNVGGFLP